MENRASKSLLLQLYERERRKSLPVSKIESFCDWMIFVEETTTFSAFVAVNFSSSFIVNFWFSTFCVCDEKGQSSYSSSELSVFFMDAVLERRARRVVSGISMPFSSPSSFAHVFPLLLARIAARNERSSGSFSSSFEKKGKKRFLFFDFFVFRRN